ncbi:MAG: lipopolysaccharide transport system ATP-binding protein [Acidobacteriota bacterium]|jgi:lipopolysaccharide transport system ATP-binding protein|nr:lipopolysaccharide transport system ATP-binding protein [Acidobacteriota bacterium]
MKPIIKIEHLGKRYRIGAQQAAYGSLRDTLAGAFRAPLRLWQRKVRVSASSFWAVKDVSFEVQPGEIVGIIGRNGAGKSTLLKLLSRITEPTSGRIELYGRIASLLEVGTGFHPELSGRENIYLNGAILGMARAEIKRKFDEIVAFAEVERFIDTPVKHFSSGMYLRLAFAVAAHLEPEILLVDEVLAVGDSRFQRKCLDKMQEVGRQGRTVLFVSHNMPAITRLCPRTILLDGGRVIGDGPSSQIVGAYLSSGLGTTAERVWADLSTAPGNDIVRLCAVRVRTEDGEVSDALDIRRPLVIEMEYEVLKASHVLTPNFHFYNEEGIYAFIASETDPAWRDRIRPEGRYLSTARIPGNLLSEGTLFVGAAISTMSSTTIHFYERDAVAFQVIDSLDGDSARGDYAGQMPGVVRPMLQWSTRVLLESNQPVAAQAGEGAR